MFSVFLLLRKVPHMRNNEWQQKLAKCRVALSLYNLSKQTLWQTTKTFFVMVNWTSCDTIQINLASNRVSNEINHLITPESVYDTKSCYQLILSKTNNKMRESQYWNNGTQFSHRPKRNHLSETFSATVSFSLLSRLSTSV